MVSEDHFCYVLVSIDFEYTPKIELLEDSMHEDLIPYIEVNCVQIHDAPQVGAYGYDQNFIFDFIYVHVMIDVHSYCY